MRQGESLGSQYGPEFEAALRYSGTNVDDCGSRGDLERRAKKVKSPFVFPSKGNLERPIGSVRKAHDAPVEKAGIKEHFRLYDLRHTYATRAVAAGVDLATLSDILGHTSIQMTMRHVHPGEEQRKLAAGKFETFRVAGIVEAMEKSRAATAISTSVQ